MLSNDQLKAKQEIINWLVKPNQPYMLLTGWAGTGKSTMMRDFMDNLDTIQKDIKNSNPDYVPIEVTLTATTNKAAGALSLSTGGRPVETIHSLLRLRVVTDKDTNKTKLEQKELVAFVNQLVVIDEAYCMNFDLLEIVKETELVNSKVLFIGDPTQLLGVGEYSPTLINTGWPEATLTEVLRQDKNNPIQAFCADLREFILGRTKSFPLIDLDGIKEIEWLDQREFNKEIIKEFSRPDWKDNDSKVLAYTNKTVVAINKFVSGKVTGLLELDVGDLAINNNYVKVNKQSVNTDEVVQITGIRDGEFKVFDKIFKGRWVRVNNMPEEFFLPNNLKDKNVAIERALKTFMIYEINNKWIDLRAAFACTVNKSQGSTYNTVFVDLTDIGVCRSQNQLARLIYVAISRAKYKVYFTGDIG